MYSNKHTIRSEKWLQYRYTEYRLCADRRNIPWNLSLKEFCDALKKTCTYCGLVSRGLDRVDNLRGYEKDNIIACCTWCNVSKNKYTTEFFIGKCIKVVEKAGYIVIKPKTSDL